MVLCWMGKRLLLFTATVLGISIVLYPAIRPHEPQYRSKALSSWLADLDAAASSPPEKTTEAINAVKTIGTNCFPWLRHMLASEESVWERTAAALETRQAMIHFSLVPARLTRARAVEGYAVLGTVAEAAVPDLIELMDPKRSPEVRIVAARALGQIGPGARQAIPALQRALQDANAEVSKSAMFALANIQMSIRDLSMRERRF